MPAKRKTKRRNLYIGIAIVVVAVLLITHPWSRKKEEPVIRTARVERGVVTASVSANGVLEPLTTVEVKSNVGGQIVSLDVDEGDVVQPGQLIARIDPTDALTAYEQSQADLASARSKVNQAREQLAMQGVQDTAQVQSAREGLWSARAKLLQSKEQAKAQPSLTSASVAQAKAGLASAEASLLQTKNALIPQKLSAAQAAYDQANATYDTAQKDLARQRELLSKGFVPKSQVELSEEKTNVAKAQLDTARRKLDTVKDETDQELTAAQARVAQAQADLDNANANTIQVKIKDQDLRVAEAAVKQAEATLQSAIASQRQIKVREGDVIQADSQVQRSEASLRNAKTELGYTTIVAPRAGIVVKKYVEEGSIVTGGRSSFSGSGSGVGIVDIADVSRMFATVNVDETDIAQIEVGQEVDVIVEAYPDEFFSGTVTKIAPQSVTEQNVTTVPVTVEIEMPDMRLKPGMNVTCDFITGRADDVLMVPSEAVDESENGASVTVLDQGKQVIRKVEAGLVGTNDTEIIKGLKEGEQVVTSVFDPNASNNSSGQSGRAGGFGGPGGGMRRSR